MKSFAKFSIVFFSLAFSIVFSFLTAEISSEPVFADYFEIITNPLIDTSGFTNHEQISCVENLDQSQKHPLNISILFLANESITPLSGIWVKDFSEWKNISHNVSVSVPDYGYCERYVEYNFYNTTPNLVCSEMVDFVGNPCTELDESHCNCSSDCKTGSHTEFEERWYYDWKPAKMQYIKRTANEYRENMGVINIGKGETKCFRITYHTDIVPLEGGGWGSWGEWFLVDETTGSAHGPEWNASYGKRKNVTMYREEEGSVPMDPDWTMAPVWFWFNVSASDMVTSDISRVYDSDGNEVCYNVWNNTVQGNAYMLILDNHTSGSNNTYSIYYANKTEGAESSVCGNLVTWNGSHVNSVGYTDVKFELTHGAMSEMEDNASVDMHYYSGGEQYEYDSYFTSISKNVWGGYASVNLNFVHDDTLYVRIRSFSDDNSSWHKTIFFYPNMMGIQIIAPGQTASYKWLVQAENTYWWTDDVNKTGGDCTDYTNGKLWLQWPYVMSQDPDSKALQIWAWDDTEKQTGMRYARLDDGTGYARIYFAEGNVLNMTIADGIYVGLYIDYNTSQQGYWEIAYQSVINTLYPIRAEVGAEEVEDDSTPPTIGDFKEPSDPSTYSFGASYRFNGTENDDVNSSVMIFEIDGVNYTSLPCSWLNTTSMECMATISDLGVGLHDWTWFASDTSDNWISQSGDFTVSQGTPALTLTNDGGNVTYPNPVNVSWSESNSGDGGCTYPAERNGSSAGSSPDTSVLSAGIYNYTYYTAGCTNYTDASTSIWVLVSPETEFNKGWAWNPFIGELDRYGGGLTDNSTYWLCTDLSCNTTCQVEIEYGLITGCT